MFLRFVNHRFYDVDGAGGGAPASAPAGGEMCIRDRAMAKKYKIAVGKSRKDTHWHNDELSWAELLDRLQTTIRTAETVDAYKNMSKDLQSEIKDVGGLSLIHISILENRIHELEKSK